MIRVFKYSGQFKSSVTTAEATLRLDVPHRVLKEFVKEKWFVIFSLRITLKLTYAYLTEFPYTAHSK